MKLTLTGQYSIITGLRISSGIGDFFMSRPGHKCIVLGKHSPSAEAVSCGIEKFSAWEILSKFPTVVSGRASFVLSPPTLPPKIKSPRSVGSRLFESVVNQFDYTDSIPPGTLPVNS
jgi:hypothetical protein